jgi:hypothetical protein
VKNGNKIHENVMYIGSIHYEEAYFLSVTDAGNFALYAAELVHI